jgi:rhodanese-related sulfurtransferase
VVAEDTATGLGIAPDEAAELIAAGGQLIDVRRDYEFAAGRIEGARHIEINELAGEAESIAKDRPVLFYCRTGSRSSLAAAAFGQAGWDAHNLEGGLEAWIESGNDIEPEGGEVVDIRIGS